MQGACFDIGQLILQDYRGMRKPRLILFNKAKIEAVELSEKLCDGDKKKIREAMEFLISYYIANKQSDTMWIQHPTISFDSYLGPSFSKKYLSKIPRDIITRDDRQVSGTARYKVNPEFLP